ncbi:MAG: glutamate synthase central domain-containing protein, partial [Bacteroidota bacterium]|nr:glutamate synthase central domain-containing protein [Bacteroidota bacterium]
GAEGADDKTGDGAGILVQIPHEFILLQGIPVPEKGHYGTGLVFLPKASKAFNQCMDLLKEGLLAEGLTLLAVRDVPVNSDILGEIAKSNEPAIRQIVVTGPEKPEELERKLFIARKKIEKVVANSSISEKRSFYIVSLSTKRIIYKGMLSSTQLRDYFPDLVHPNFTSAISLVHSRFSTNTFPTWDLAQPFRLLGHNGEINTIKGNRFWMKARESVLKSELLGDMEAVYPVLQPGMSDSASLDNMLEFLVMSGKTLPHALSMLVPDSWNDKNPIPDKLKAFYEYHSILMEPWDGPATLLFSDGRYVGGMLDRNGLRPARYLITKDGVMVAASETGVQTFPADQIREKGRLKPGKMILVDTETHHIEYDAELKEELASAFPYREWLEKYRINISSLSSGREVKTELPNLNAYMNAFGYSKEDIERLMIPMALEGKEPTASMGNDTPIAVLSDKPQLLYAYFRQLFAQVTNPPIDPIREELVMSLNTFIGSHQANMLVPNAEHCKVVKMKTPILTNREFDLLKNIRYKGFSTVELPMLFPLAEGAKGLEKAVNKLCLMAEDAVNKGHNYLILTDRGVNAEMVAIPSLLAVSAVHHHLIECRKRMQIDIVVESAEPREIMHFALLLGYGASVINPYGAFAVLNDLVKKKEIQSDYETAESHYIKSVNKGLLKVLSKMGISTVRSYRGAQIFEAVGISSDVLSRYFDGTTSKIEGITLEDIATDAII